MFWDGELLEQGAGLVAVTAFLVAWVTVGLIQLSVESILLGKKFAVSRNIFQFRSLHATWWREHKAG